MKTVVEIPDGFEVDLEKTTSTNIVLKKVEKKKPKTWEEIQKEQANLNTKQFYLDPHGCITPYTLTLNTIIVATRYHVPTKRDAERVRALCQLLVIADYYNEGWEPDWGDGSELKYCVCYTKKDNTYHIVSSVHSNYNAIYFKTKELAKEALGHNRDIFDNYFGFTKQ